jgi:hypothetical protein
MAGWISAFKAIPWGELLAAAPVVVRGTRTLLDTVRHRKAAEPGHDLGSRVRSLEAQVTELRGELTAASTLMTTLAEQNARLVEALGIMQRRSRALLALGALLAAAVIGLIAHAVMQ